MSRFPQPLLNAGIYERTFVLVQKEGIERLHAVNALVVGLGGVGGSAAEALVRAGIGKLTICDGDVVSVTNKNRQVIALDSTVGKSKAEVMAARLRDVNPHCAITSVDGFLLPDDFGGILARQQYDYVVDCIDSVECKVALLEVATKLGIRTFSSGGAGGRLDPLQIAVADIFDTANDGLLRAVRGELRKRGVPRNSIQAVFSNELAAPPTEPQRQEQGGRDRAINGTISYLPPMFGMHLAALVIRSALGTFSPRNPKRERARDSPGSDAD